jgi:hypothetical protein
VGNQLQSGYEEHPGCGTEREQAPDVKGQGLPYDHDIGVP